MSRICTIELDARELKLAEARNGRFQRHAEAPLPEGAYDDGMPTRVLTQFLAGSLAAAGITARRARIAISDAGIAVRDFRLPLMSRQELRRAVAYEGKRLVPIDPAEAYYAWHVRRDAREFAVYLVASRRDMIDGLVGAIRATALEVEHIDLKPLALARGAAVQDGLVLDWGLGEATAVLMRDSRPQFFRTLLLDAADSDIEAQINELALSLDALVKFVRSTEGGGLIGATTPLYLSGRFGSVAGAEDQARERFKFLVRWPAPAVRWPAGFPWQAHLAAIGLATRAAWQDRINPTQSGDVRVAA